MSTQLSSFTISFEPGRAWRTLGILQCLAPILPEVRNRKRQALKHIS